jgi:DNA-binding response OmpR family regulator
VDDEANIRTALVRLLRLDGFDAIEAESGPAAVAALGQVCYDLMIVDLNLPGMGGSEVMRRARAMDPSLQMIVLTGHPTLESAIAAVRLEAVDYIQKPASLQEIAAAVRRALRSRIEELRRRQLLQVIGDAVDVLRRTGEPEPADAAEPGPSDASMPQVTLAADRRLLVLPGDSERAVELTEGEVAVLEALMSCPDRVLSCRQIVRMAWNYELEEWEAQSTVRPHVSRLRNKMEVDPNHPRWIKTVRGRGYLFAGGD